MHDDLIDAVDWAIARGIADRARVAIMGNSYFLAQKGGFRKAVQKIRRRHDNPAVRAGRREVPGIRWRITTLAAWPRRGRC
jgi:hypothetical protein